MMGQLMKPRKTEITGEITVLGYVLLPYCLPTNTASNTLVSRSFWICTCRKYIQKPCKLIRLIIQII